MPHRVIAPSVPRRRNASPRKSPCFPLRLQDACNKDRGRSALEPLSDGDNRFPWVLFKRADSGTFQCSEHFSPGTPSGGLPATLDRFPSMVLRLNIDHTALTPSSSCEAARLLTNPTPPK